MQLDELALLVYDECHHCKKSHPANMIMQNFYHKVRPLGRQPHSCCAACVCSTCCVHVRAACQLGIL